MEHELINEENMTKNLLKLTGRFKLRSLVWLMGLMPVAGLNANAAGSDSAVDAGSVETVQQQTMVRISGRVLDENKAPVAGAMILVKESGRGVISGIDGTFSIEVSSNESLEVSFLGYETQLIPVGASTQLVVELIPKASELDAVTVVAYGRQRKESIVGAINTIDSRDLNVSTGQLSTNLAGKLAGVVVMQRTGEPGAGADFWIRGINTFGENNKPLILVDGIERDMDLVDVEDIQTFSILKDATATALYGVRGANGIVLITTKRGKEGEPTVSVKAEFGMTQPVKVPSMANTEEWLSYYNELYRDAGNAPAFSDYEIQMYLSGADPDLYPSVNWVDTIFKDWAKTGRVNANVSGGSPKVRYYIGTSWYTEEGIFNVTDKSRYDANMKFDKFNFRSNVDINLTSSTELGLSLSTQYTSKNSPGLSSLETIYSYTLLTTPIATPTVFSDGTLAGPSQGRNPYNDLNNTGYTRESTIVAQSLLSLNQDFSDMITPGLSANVKFSWDADNGNVLRRHITPATYYASGRDDNGDLILHETPTTPTQYMQLSSSSTSWTTVNFEAMMLYERVFALDHRFSGMFLYSIRSRRNNTPTKTDNESAYIMAFPYKNMGIAGRFTYSFMDKYFAEFNFGYNGSENFAPGRRYGFFPSYAAGWMMSNENFWDPIRDIVTHLKVRGSYGKIGNDQIGGSRRFAYNTTLDTSASGWYWGSSGGGNYESGISTAFQGNTGVSWEEATKSDIGIEFGLFHKIRVQADYFYEKREGIFIERQSTPSIVGIINQPYVNLGKMKNQGFDMSLEYDHRFNPDLFLSVRGNFTFNRNKNLYDDRPEQIWAYQNLAGYAYNQQFGLIALGLFESEEDITNSPVHNLGTSPRVGDIKYRDINGDGVVNEYDMVPIGYTDVPEINYGFGFSLAYKSFDFSAFFSGVGNVTRIISGPNLYGQSLNILVQGQLYQDVARNRWTLDNQDPNAPYPRMSLTTVENNIQASTYWQRDMSFLRLKNAEIGYTLPKHISKKAGMSTMRIYLQGVNLLTFTKFKLWDPELSSNYGNVYPMMRVFTVGVNMNF